MNRSSLSLQLRQAARYYGDIAALRPSDLTVEPAEFMSLLGPSGSGKTTLLQLVAGYIEPSQGQVLLGGRDVTKMPARRRNIGMVFQNYALFPHMTVGENIGYGLRARRWPRQDIARRIETLLDIVQLSGFSARAIHELSGGQQQRVALARALAIEPDLVLMDEPLGALDRQLRRAVQLELRRLHDVHRRTTLYVTHDQEEALVLSDRIAVMRDGRIEQIGQARQLYERPANAFVAGFIGESNLLPGTVGTVSSGEAELDVPGLGCTLRAPAAPGVSQGQPACLLLRPEHLLIGGRSGVAARVMERVYLGELLSLRLALSSGQELWLRRLAEPTAEIGETIRIGWKPEAPWVVPVN